MYILIQTHFRFNARNWFGEKQFSRIDVTNNIVHLFRHFFARRGEASEFSNRRLDHDSGGKSWTAGKDKSRLLARDYVGLRSDCLTGAQIQNLYIRQFTNDRSW